MVSLRIMSCIASHDLVQKEAAKVRVVCHDWGLYDLEPKSIALSKADVEIGSIWQPGSSGSSSRCHIELSDCIRYRLTIGLPHEIHTCLLFSWLI